MGALSLDHVSHHFGSLLAVEDLSLSIERGELVCLLGPSGCGKTTALRIAAGLERLQQGRVLLGDKVIADSNRSVAPEDRGVGLVFQDYALFPHLSVLDNVAFGLRRMPAEERRRRSERALTLVGMGDQLGSFPHMLSGGQQQRVALARALAPQPPVMLLDEPFSGLDTSLRNQVRDETLHVLKEVGAAVLMVTHDPEEAMFMADRIALMRAGRLVQVGTPTELYFAPKDAFAAGFFGDINRIDAVVRNGEVETPLGALDANGLPDGASVEVLIRPEALRLEPAETGTPAETGELGLAEVMAARLLGRTSLIHLSVPSRTAQPLHLHARIPGRFLPEEGARMVVRLDRTQSFVFASSLAT